jgi:uncharacterized protein YqgC (DUF456 family)
METTDVGLLIIAAIVMCFGTFAAVLPLVPGPALVWFSAVIYAIATNFRQVGIAALVVLTLLMLLGSTTNLWMSALGVKAVGGSGWGVLGGMIGMLLGTLIFFPIGAIIGAVVGTLSAEYLHTKDWKQALKIGGGTAGGFLLGVAAELVIALVMDVVFIVSLLITHPAF